MKYILTSNEMKRLIAPSILAANFAELGKDIELINQSEADWIHVDIMDGVFVPNISFGIPICEAVKKTAKKPIDVHLMIVNPERYIGSFKNAGAQSISVHYEACPHLQSVITQIKSFRCKAGVAINPHTPISVLEDIIQDLDMINLMSVNPGFGGQKFIPHTFTKLEKLRNMIDKSGSHALIEIDGGVNSENAHKLFELGANVLVAGNIVFSSQNPSEMITMLKHS